MKKAMMILIPALALALVFGVAGTGCKRKETANPAAPAIPTSTPTITLSPTHTGTATLSFTQTATPTFTRTATATITNTPIFSFTFTLSPTITPTFTDTLSPTPTSTFTVTSTPTETRTPTHTLSPTNTFSPTATFTATVTATPCNAILKPLYAFNTDTECWYLNSNTDADTAQGSVLSWQGVTFHTGPGAMAVSATYNGTQQKVQVEIAFPTQYNIAGYTFRFRTLYSAAARGTAGYGAVQPFVQNNTSWDASWISLNSSQLAAWTQSSWVIPTNANTQNANKIGIQIYIGTNGAPGYVYVDEIELVAPPTPTPTFTLPVGITATDTPTFTPTATSCTPVFQPTYAFGTSSECWTSGGTKTNLMGWSGVTFDVGPGAMAPYCNFSSPVAAEEMTAVQIDFPSPYVNITGAQITFRARFSSQVIGTATYGVLQPFVQDSTWSWDANYQWISAANLASWNTYTLNLTSSTNNMAAVQRVGIQIMIGPGGGPGYVYIDEFKFNIPVGTLTPTPTVTFTPTALQAWTFDSTVESWAFHTGDGTIDPGTATLNQVASANGATGVLDAYIPFSAPNEFEWIKLEPAAGAVNLSGGKAIRMRIWMDAAVAGDGYPGAQIFVQSGTGWTWENMGWANLTPGAWTDYTFVPPFSTAGTDAADIKRFGVQIHMGGAGTTRAAGHIMIDKVEVFQP
jgi:hypothetical protein